MKNTTKKNNKKNARAGCELAIMQVTKPVSQPEVAVVVAAAAVVVWFPVVLAVFSPVAKD